MAAIQEVCGKRFSRLVAIEFSHRHGGDRFYRFACDCGTEKVINLSNVRKGRTASCGCLWLESVTAKRPDITKHGLNLHPLYNTWRGILNRCYNESRHNYKYYGGRGITVCDRWRNSMALFLEDIGDRPSPKHTLDRIDNDGNYEPGNIRWAEWHDQRMNQRQRAKAAV